MLCGERNYPEKQTKTHSIVCGSLPTCKRHSGVHHAKVWMSGTTVMYMFCNKMLFKNVCFRRSFVRLFPIHHRRYIRLPSHHHHILFCCACRLSPHILNYPFPFLSFGCIIFSIIPLTTTFNIPFDTHFLSLLLPPCFNPSPTLTLSHSSLWNLFAMCDEKLQRFKLNSIIAINT